MKSVNKILSVFLAVLMMFSIIPMANIEAEAANYNASAAVSFANSHWNDGIGLCAEFVSRCLNAGGITVPNKASYYSSSTQSYKNNSGTLGAYTNPYTCSASLLLYLSEHYQIITNPSSSDIAVGDVVFMYGGSSGQWKDGHVGIVISKTNGVPVYAAHNRATNSGKFSSSYPCTYVAKMNGIITTHKVDSSYGKNFTAYPKAKITASNIFDANHNQISSTAWIGTSDKCTIHEVYTDGCCKVSYPLDGGGTKTVYSKIKSFIIEHTHSYSTYYEAAHPHKIYKKCSCGDWYYTGEYKTVSSCSSCQPPSGYHMWFDGGTKYYLYDTITVNAESNNAKQYQFVFTLPSGKDNYTDWMANGEFSATSNETGTYKVSYLAKNDYGTYDTRKDGCTLTFYYVAPTISISNSTSVSLKVGNTHQIYLTADTGDNDTDISFSSSNTNVATVSSSGLITAKSSGTSTITAKLVYHGDNGDYTTSCKMTVSVSEKIYTVKFNANGGSGTMSNQSFTYNTAKALTANSFTRTGYTFLGWSTSSTATSATYTDKQSVENLTSTDGGTVTLYAVWKPNTYTVKFNANGGSGTMSNQSFTYDTAKALTANSFTRTGYTFLGWSTSSTATSATYTDKQFVKNLTTTNGGYVTLYAVWQKDPVTVSSISIATKPTKTEYYVGDTFNSSGLSVKITMSDGTTKTLTSGFTVSKPNMSTAGTKTVTITYSEKKASFTIKVIERPVAPDAPDTNFTLSIQEPSRTEIRNKDGIVLHTVVEGKLPDGARIEWSWDNNKFDVEENDDGTLTIIARNNGETTITATVYGADGDILATDSVVMNSKSGFFDKIGGFFRSLFGTTKIYDK